MGAFNSPNCDQVDQILMQFGNAPERGYTLNELRGRRFHHTVINGFLFIYLLIFTMTRSPFHPVQNSSKAHLCAGCFGFSHYTTRSHPSVKEGPYTPTS